MSSLEEDLARIERQLEEVDRAFEKQRAGATPETRRGRRKAATGLFTSRAGKIALAAGGVVLGFVVLRGLMRIVLPLAIVGFAGYGVYRYLTDEGRDDEN